MVWFFIAITGILTILIVINIVNQKKVVKLFKQGNSMVSGYRGKGKDLLFHFVINKRKENYISNVEYSDPKKRYKHFDFNTKVWELAGNTYQDFAEGTTKTYTYPYPDGIDYYISDCGIYFPSQYHKELDKKYKSAPVFQALSRQLGDCNVHTNSQAQNRVWDKMREQAEVYIVCNWVKFIGRKRFIQKLTVYDKAESAELKVKKPWFGLGKTARAAALNFETQHGKIYSIIYSSKIKYNFDSRRFKKILENGDKDYENDREAQS